MRIIKIFLFITVFVILGSCTTSKINNKRYSQDSYEEFPENYIPKNLNEALTYLNSIWTESDKEEYRNMDEGEAVAELHMGTGQSIRNSWGLWAKKKNSLKKYFNSLGISHPDDISSIVLTSFHRQLCGKDINLDEQTEEYIKYRQKIENIEKEAKSQYKSFAVGDTVNVPFGTYKSGNETRFSLYSNGSNDIDFDCVIIGVIKNKKKKELLTIQALDICCYEKVDIESIKTITIGQTFEYNMRYFMLLSSK